MSATSCTVRRTALTAALGLALAVPSALTWPQDVASAGLSTVPAPRSAPTLPAAQQAAHVTATAALAAATGLEAAAQVAPALKLPAPRTAGADAAPVDVRPAAAPAAPPAPAVPTAVVAGVPAAAAPTSADTPARVPSAALRSGRTASSAAAPGAAIDFAQVSSRLRPILKGTRLVPSAAAPGPVDAPQPPSPDASAPGPVDAPQPPSPDAPAPSVTSPAAGLTPAHLGAVAFRGQAPQLTNLNRYSYVQLNAWEEDRARALKAANPALKVLVYKDASSTRDYAVRNGVDDAELPTGVGYADADRNHSDWFLKDTTGARLAWPYGGHWWMDVANPGYQRAWLANVKADLADGPWDGVIIDNVMASPEWYLPSSKTINSYRTKAAYEAATESFLRAVAPALRSTGAMVMGNISDASPTTWDRWVSLLSGGNHEHSFAWPGAELYGGGSWLERVQEIERTQRLGRVHTATSEAASSDLRTLTYMRASWLLAWDGGRSGSAQMIALSDKADTWNPIVAADLGVPTGARTAVGGAWTRSYSKGLTVANPSSSTVTVPLGGSYRTLAGAQVTSVTLAPLSGALLLR